jgi:rRNA maturation RNase YbeY
MIDFAYQTDFKLQNEEGVAEWISEIIVLEGFAEGDITYIFCDDDYLLKINQEFLNHDTLTDIISFDYSLGKQIHGEIYISTNRVADNAEIYETGFNNELHRVIIHGILHYCGYKDKTELDIEIMRRKEEKALELRTFC